MTEHDLKQRMESYIGIFTNPPENIPTTNVVDAPLIGNGDVGSSHKWFT